MNIYKWLIISSMGITSLYAQPVNTLDTVFAAYYNFSCSSIVTPKQIHTHKWIYHLHNAYKWALASQDIPNVCRFYPSCSQYAVLAVEKYGLFRGTLHTADRLTRCNGRQHKAQYPVHSTMDLYIDYP